MATTNIAPAPTAETSPQTPQADPQVQAQTPEQGGSPQDQSRRELYARIYGGQQAAAEPQSQDPEPSAQDGQVVEGSEGTPVTPPPDPAEQRFSKMEETLSQITNVLSQLVQKQAPTPPVSAAPEPQAQTPGKWLELLREGKIAEAEEELAKTLANKFVPQAKSEATTDALEMFRVEQELTSYVSDLRRENPDLLPLEDTIAAKAKVRLEAAQASGKIRTADEYIAAYKDAVSKAADEARKIVQTIRAAGKEEANTRNREVLSSSTVPPNAIPQNRPNPQTKVAPKVETTEDYLARRRAMANRGAGLAVS